VALSWKQLLDSNTVIRPSGRDSFIVERQGHRLEVQVETQTVGPSKVVYASTVRGWLPPHSHEVLSPVEKDDLLRLIGEFFRENGFTCVIVPEKSE
jgi:hypothetical protein